MAIKSNNTQGNPYHDEQTGEFTSANSSSEKSQQVNPVTTSNEAQPVKTFKFKIKGNVEDLRDRLQKSKQISSIPFLSSAYDVEENLENFFTPEIINNIDSKFGKFNIPYKYFNLRTDPQQRCGVNIFAACIGKKRWPNNYLRLVDYQEYDRLLTNYRHRPLYRGLRGSDTEFETIANSYSSKENEMIYGSVGGTAYGIAVYASNYRSEAVSYAGGYRDHVMDMILDTNARTMSYSQICRIRNDLSNRKEVIRPKVEKIFIDNGIEPSKARQMAVSFTDYTLTDEGFVAMLCGVEWYQSGSYHMIENLGCMYRLLR